MVRNDNYLNGGDASIMGNERFLLVNGTVIDGTGRPSLHHTSIGIVNGRFGTITQHSDICRIEIILTGGFAK